MQNETQLKAAIENSSDFKQAVADFIGRADLFCQHAQIGELVQDMFYNGEIVFNGVSALQVPRVCAGIGRTPAGTTVFTYAADFQEGQNFPFELDIPKAGSGLKVMPTEHPIQPQSPPPIQPTAADMKATVHNDLRLCIPRAALEALLHATGRAMSGNGEVFVRFEDNPDRAIVSLDNKPTSVNYDISTARGRVLFPKAGSGQFAHGDIFLITVQGDELVVDIENAL